MNKQEFVEAIRAIVPEDGVEANEANIEGVIFLLLKNGLLSLLNLNNEDKISIINEYIQKIRSKCLCDDYDLTSYSTGENRNDLFYVFDFEDLPDTFQKMAIPRGEHEDIQNFNAVEHGLNEVSGIIVYLSNGEKDIVLFKNVYAIEIIGVQSKILLIKQNERFERATNDMIRLTPDFDVILVDDHYVITNIKNAERIQQLTQITINTATSKIDEIESIHVVYDIDRIKNMVKEDLSLAKKVIKIVSDSMVLSKKIPSDRIISFAKEKEPKFGRLTYNDDETQFSITSKKELKQLLSILNDDILKSELTQEDYNSTAKDQLQ